MSRVGNFEALMDGAGWRGTGRRGLAATIFPALASKLRSSSIAVVDQTAALQLRTMSYGVVDQ